jgi:hypothetical protein
VAAIIASGVLILNACRIKMAIRFISAFNSIITQSFNRDSRAILSASDNKCHPNNSISEITETIAVPSRKGAVFSRP